MPWLNPLLILLSALSAPVQPLIQIIHDAVICNIKDLCLPDHCWSLRYSQIIMQSAGYIPRWSNFGQFLESPIWWARISNRFYHRTGEGSCPARAFWFRHFHILFHFGHHGLHTTRTSSSSKLFTLSMILDDRILILESIFSIAPDIQPPDHADFYFFCLVHNLITDRGKLWSMILIWAVASRAMIFRRKPVWSGSYRCWRRISNSTVCSQSP